MHKLNILICDDMEHVRLSHEHNIKECSEKKFRPMIELAASPDAAIELVKESLPIKVPYDLVLMDIDFGQTGSKLNGFEAANTIQKLSPSTVIVMVSAYSTDDNLMLAEQSPHVHRFFRRGTFSKDELFETCIYALVRRLHSRSELLPKKDATFTQSRVMQDYLNKVDQIGPNHSIVIYGETGTGKELTAKRINANTMVFLGQESRPLVTINCGGLSDTLRTSELFGYVRGAFTGANQDTPGLLERAEGGDVFLDELQNAPRNLQEILMRVLQDKEFTPVGGRVSKKLNVRFITALNKNPADAKKSGSLMPDLIARLQQEYLVIPPLRERKGDIPALIQYFKELDGKADKTFSSEAIAFLESMAWPTNVRGLSNVVLEAIHHTKIPVITPSSLTKLPSVKEMMAESEETTDNSAKIIPGHIEAKIDDLVTTWLAGEGPLDEPLKAFEKKVLTRLWLEKQSISYISRRASLPKTTVRRKLVEHGIADVTF